MDVELPLGLNATPGRLGSESKTRGDARTRFTDAVRLAERQKQMQGKDGDFVREEQKPAL